MVLLFYSGVACVLLFTNSVLSSPHPQAGLIREDSIAAGSRQLGEICILDLHCATRYSKCTNTCQCRPGYEKKDGECVANIGGYCDASNECSDTLPNSECVDSFCRCVQDYTPWNRKECLKPARANEECKVTEQCTKYLGPMGMCRPSQNYSTNTCQCPLRFHQLVNGTCYRNKGFNEQCNMDDECYAENTIIVCRMGVCSCPEGMTLEDGRYCKGAAAAITQTILMVLLMSVLSKIL